MFNILQGTPSASSYGTSGPFQLVSQDEMQSAWGAASIDTLSVRTQMQTPHQGLRTGINQKLSVDVAPATNPTTGQQASYVGGHFYTEASVSLGGGTGAFGDYLGSVFAVNPQVILESGATAFARVTGGEFDVSVASSTPPAQSFGISIVHNSGHSTPAAYDDAALLVADQSGITAKWKTGLQFGGQGAANWPLASTSTIIGAVPRMYPSADTPVATYGVDFSKVQFQSGGAAFKSTGFSVDPNGVVTSAFASSTADPTTSNIAAGLCEDWQNTTAGTMKRWCNVGGTLKSITYN